jgi:hypothetical protein
MMTYLKMKLEKALPKTSYLLKSRGQSAVLLLGVAIMGALVVVGFSLASLNASNVQQNFSTGQSLQMYYTAQAGIREVIANRFVPRNNFLAFRGLVDSALPINQRAMYPLSGRVFKNPNTPSSGVLGYYRYMVLGGDPFVEPASGNYYGDLSAALTAGSTGWLNPTPRQFYYIVSRGSVCEDANGNVLTDALKMTYDASQPNLTTGKPSCTTGTFRELTLLAVVDASRTVNTTQDVIREFKVYQNSADPIKLNTPTRVPGYGLTGPGVPSVPVNTFDFEVAWQNNATGAKPVALVTHMMTSPLNLRVFPITGTTLDITATPLDPRAVVRVLFDRDVDYRSLYLFNMDSNGADNRSLLDPARDGCPQDMTYCGVRMQKLNTTNVPFTPPQFYASASFMPMLPSTSQVFFFPPPPTGSTAMASGSNYLLEINPVAVNSSGVTLPGVRDSKGNRDPLTYSIRFRVQ